MRLGLCLLHLRPGKIGGAEALVRALVAHLPSALPGDSLVAVLDRDLARDLPTPGWERAVLDRSARAVVAERLLEAFTPWRARAAERLFASLRLDLALFPQQSIYPRNAPVRAVLTAVDIQHHLHPENFGLFDRAYRPAVYPSSMARSERVVTISEHVRRTLVEGGHVAPGKVEAIRLGYTPRGSGPVEPYRHPGGPYLYYPAFSHPHKNHEALLRSYATLVRRGAVRQPLLFTGGKTSHWKRIDRLVGALGLRERVTHLGLVPSEQVALVYAGADTVVFPSRYEGFGLPVLEAVSLGKRVVASRLEVFDEIGLPPQNQIDFSDPDQLLAALALPSPTALLKPPWTWQDMARAYAALLHRVAAAPAGS